MTAPAATDFDARCEECRSTKTCTSAREKELWLAHHTHDRSDDE